MLFLNESHIRQAMSMRDVIDAIDRAYKIYMKKQFHMPTRLQVTEKDNTLLLMPCFINEAIATKLVTVFPNNRQHQLPTIYGLVILNDQKTGEIKAILDGAFLTGYRTGAVGGSAIRHLARDDVDSIAVVGTGVQGLYQTIAACTERPINHIYAYNRTPEKVHAFKEKLKSWTDPTIKIHPTKKVADAIKPAQIVITATTSLDPVLPNADDLLKEKLYIAIGSFKPNMRELPEACFQLADKIFVDSTDAIKESGDLQIPLEKQWITTHSIHQFASVLTNKFKFNKNQAKTTIFKSSGMALFDTVVANEIYKQAVEKNIGQQIDL